LKRLRWAAVSTASLDLLDKAGLADPADVTIVPNPIGSDKIAPRRADGPFTIAYLGGPATFKGIHVIPGVIELLSDRSVHWFVVVGSRRTGDSGNPVLAAIQALARPEVQISGWVSDPREVYAIASVVFCPSFRESFGRVAAEAMVNGIPVVASDLPAFRELIGDNEAGLLFPPGDANAAAAALSRLVDDADLRERLGQAGRARAARFAPAVAVDTLAELYGTR
jgi:glycosyltransferase involved in cell wall biosynthesis